MATSGTIGRTTINTAKMLEKALRRCGLTAATVTPEIVDTAKEDLFMFLMSLANRGLNLWCIDKQLLGLGVGKGTYVLPVGTMDVLNLMQSTPTLDEGGVEVAGVDSCALSFTEDVACCRFGIKFGASIGLFTFDVSDDGLAWTTVLTNTDAVDTVLYNWYDVDPAQTHKYFRVSCVGGSPVEMLIATQYRDIPISQFNRDDYTAQPNKLFSSSTITNFYFEKLVNPQITVWPRPNTESQHMTLWRYRQIQDVGLLTDELEIPNRWLEPISWHLALRLSFEVPGVTPDRQKAIQQMAMSMVIEVEGGETDSAPTYFAPNIGVYTR